jgi:hypothetical protein
VGTMKTLSGTVGIVVLAGVAIVTILSCCERRLTAKQKYKFTLNIGRTPTEFVDVSNKVEFINALSHLNEDQYYIDYKNQDRDTTAEHYPPLPKLSIKTDKVTISEVVQNVPTGESAPNDPNAVYRVMSDSHTDIENVLKTFK